MKEKRSKRLWIRVTEGQYREISSQATRAGVSMGDWLLHKALNIKIVKLNNLVRECPQRTKDNRSGKTYEGKQQYILKKKFKLESDL